MLGAPGAGKGTQAKRFAVLGPVPHISTGDIFRANLEGNTELGGRVKSYLDSGKLVPDELTCEIVADRLLEADCAQGYVLDGFPRTVPQAETFQGVLDDSSQQLDAAINIYVPDEEIVVRLSARRTCPNCGRIYNMDFDAPSDGIHCDEEDCERVEIVQRVDDCEETILERLRVYHEMTEPIIDYYEKQGILKTVTGEGSTPDDVFEQINGVLSLLKQS